MDQQVFRPDARIFASRFWGFSPDSHPAITFGQEGHRDRLLRYSRAGDLVLFVGTQNEPTAPEERGRLLGLVEHGRQPVEALRLINREDAWPHEFVNGRYKWPKALPMLRAWRLNSQPYLVDVLKKQLPMYATVGVVQLDDEDRDAVLSLARTEVEVRQSTVLQALRSNQEALRYSGPTTGPVASSWTASISRDVNGAAYTYALRFGRHDVWKIGWAKDPVARCASFNQHIPGEVIKESWSVAYKHLWPTGTGANEMEQRVLIALSRFRTTGERIQCPERVLSSAWTNAAFVSLG